MCSHFLPPAFADPLTWCGPILVPVLCLQEQISSLFFPGSRIHLCHTVDSTCRQHTNALITHLHVHAHPRRLSRTLMDSSFRLHPSSLVLTQAHNTGVGRADRNYKRDLFKGSSFQFNYGNVAAISWIPWIYLGVTDRHWSFHPRGSKSLLLCTPCNWSHYADNARILLSPSPIFLVSAACAIAALISFPMMAVIWKTGEAIKSCRSVDLFLGYCHLLGISADSLK